MFQFAKSENLRYLVHAVAGITTMLMRIDSDIAVIQDMRADLHRMLAELTNLQITQAAATQVIDAADHLNCAFSLR